VRRRRAGSHALRRRILERLKRAWTIVRHDPCRYAEYRRFAAYHRNPVKRRRMIERLAYQGCSRPARYHDRYYR